MAKDDELLEEEVDLEDPEDAEPAELEDDDLVDGDLVDDDPGDLDDDLCTRVGIIRQSPKRQKTRQGPSAPPA